MTYNYANIDELNYGVSIEDLNAVEEVCNYLKSANPYETRKKSLSEWSLIAKTDNELSINYAVNIAKTFFYGTENII